MRTIEVRITGMFVRKDDKNAGVQGEGNATQLHITFDATWDGYGKRLIWRNAQGQDPVSLVLAQPEEDSQQRAYTTPIPAEALKLPGWCSFTVEGYRSGAEGEADSAALTVRDYLQVLENDSYYSPAQPTPTEAQQILGALGQAVERVDASAQEAESWAVGGTGTRDGEDTDNAKYYAGEAAQSAADALASQEAAGDSEAAAAESAQAAGESAAQAQSAQSKAQAAQGAAESARDAAMEAQQGAQSALSAAQAAQGAAERAQSAAQSSEQRAAESATSAQESARSAQESAAAAQTASAQAQAAQTAAQTASDQAQSAQLAVEEAREDTLAALSAAQVAREGAEQARDQAQEIVGGDFATRSEAQGYVNSHNASDLSHPAIRPALSDHAASRSNPHGVTAAQAGAISASEKGTAGGVASLGADGKVPAGQLPQMDYDPAGSAAAVQTALTSHTSNKANPHGVTAAQVGAVPTSRTVNGKALSANISLTAANVGADPAGTASGAVSAHNQDGSAHPALQAKLEGMKTAVTATYPVAAGQTIQAGDVVDVVNGEIVVDKTVVLSGDPVRVSVGGLTGIQGTCRSAYKISDTLYLTALHYSSGNVVAVTVDYSSGTPEVAIISGAGFSSVLSPEYCCMRAVPGTSYYLMSALCIPGSTSYISFVLLDVSDGKSVRVINTASYTVSSGYSYFGEFAIVPAAESGQYWIYFGRRSYGAQYLILSVTITESGISDIEAKDRSASLSVPGYASNGFFAFLNDLDGKVFFACEVFNSGDGRSARTILAVLSVSQDTGAVSISAFRSVSSIHMTNQADVRCFYTFPNDATQFVLAWNSSVSGAVVFSNAFDGSDNYYATYTWPLNKFALLPGYGKLEVGSGAYIAQFDSYDKESVRVTPLKPDDAAYIVWHSAAEIFYSTSSSSSPLYSEAYVYDYTSSQAIALQSGTEGQPIDIIYSGITAADFVTEGQTITSDGVYGAGVLDGVLQVWSKDRPLGLQIETGSYEGVGRSGASNPNSITLSFQPKFLFIMGTDSNGYLLSKYMLANIAAHIASGINCGNQAAPGGTGSASGGSTYYSIITSDPDSTTVTWYHSSTAAGQFNESGATYYYLAIG